ncbi:hypothetical protein PIB30_022427 [Stylosanthes scabra]|uniref:Secreted protein n=1 Tax=Stylosanthes scabra TaxID=79078 RepID=A0ABU6Q9S5_9FABA|nr:hypothetical protein [Stylosanthes scabra]
MKTFMKILIISLFFSSPSPATSLLHNYRIFFFFSSRYTASRATLTVETRRFRCRRSVSSRCRYRFVSTFLFRLHFPLRVAVAYLCLIPPSSSLLFLWWWSIVVRTGPLTGPSHLKDRKCTQTSKNRIKPAGSV